MDYQNFLEQKQIVDLPTGLEFIPELNPMLFDFQRDIVEWALKRGRAAIFADCGTGKGQPYGSQVLTPNGWANIEDLAVGSLVIASDGQSYPVTGVYPKGELDTYTFHFSDKVSFDVDIDHLHIVRTNNDRQRSNRWRVMSTTDLIEANNLRYGKDGKSRNYDIPVVAPCDFGKKGLPIHPYVIGCLLGNGHFDGNVFLSSSDSELIDRFQDLLPEGVALKQKSKYDWRIITGLTGTRKHPFRQTLDDMGLLGTRASTKFVPKEYLYGSVEQRIELLRGLMDTDGYIGDTSEYYTTSNVLADDVMFLIRSLGGIPTRSIKKAPKYRDTDGNIATGQPCHIITFSLATFNPFYTPRKAHSWNPSPRDNGRWIDRIEYAGKQRTVCISVDSPDSSYVTEHFIVTHNTPMQLEWAKHIPGDVLIVAPLAVAQQTIREGQKFGIEVGYSRDGAKQGKITITNYEMLHMFSPGDFQGMVLDESSILKSFSGVYRKELTEFGHQIPYRLACTATPAPNDLIEITNHAEFLDVMTGKEIIALFFIQDGNTTHNWRLKGHGEDEFWKWMASWCVALRSPADLDYDDSLFQLPPLMIHEDVIEVEDAPEGLLFALQAQTLDERRKARASSIEDRVEKMAQIIGNSAGPWLVWCNLNRESELATKAIDGAVEVKGSDSIEHKTQAMMDFAAGKIRCMVTKPSIAGFGMNWQNCANVIFLGLSDSYEQFYQAIRRCWRFGQTRPVHAHIVIASTEGNVRRNIERKEAQATEMMSQIVKHMKGLQLNKQKRGIMAYAEDTARGNGWELMLGDSCERIKEIESDSIGLSVFSPPFPGMYAYTNSPRDIGNVTSTQELIEHFRFIMTELYRITIPGRSCAIHLTQEPIFMQQEGYSGLRDFRGDVIRAMQDANWIYASERTLDKDPQLKAARTKDHGLAMKTAAKDSARLTGTMPDYLLQFRKHGENPIPIRALIDHQDPKKRNPDGWITREEWIQWASAVWYGYHRIGKGGIRETDVLSVREGREDKDEKHLCPLQLGVIERAIKLWSAPGDTVFSPFAGIGSEGYMAIKLNRQFIGIELKESYWRVAQQNLKAAEVTGLELFTQNEETA